MTELERVKIWNENFYKWNAFDQNDFTWIVLGDTFSIKEELKTKGAKFNRELGWHFDHEEAGYDLVKIIITEVAEKTIRGKYRFKEDAEEYIKNIRKANEKFVPTHSEWIGEVGKKVSIDVTLENYREFYTAFGETAAYEFKDSNGNTVVWLSASGKDFDKDHVYWIEGTVKDHSEYRGDKQTRINRCKIKGVWKK